MPRYEVKQKVKEASVNINGSLNPKRLQENSVDVLTLNNIAKSINSNDDKIPTVKLLKDILKGLNLIESDSSGNVNIGVGGSGSGISEAKVLEIVSSKFLENFLDNILKEKDEKLAKSNILIDSTSTPELIGDPTRTALINSSMEYIKICDEMKEYIETLFAQNSIIDSTVEEELDKKYTIYKTNLNLISFDTQNATNKLAKIRADLALEEANKHTDNIANQIVYKLEIHSTNGAIFKKGTIDTTLTAVLYKGKEIVTEQFPPIRFKWTRKSHDVISDDRWNNSSRRAYSIKITNVDVIGGQCTFNCEVLDESGNVLVSAN